ncbi:MAG: PIN domain nuclease [Candidatus Latescibacterota bacterium]
MILVDTSVWIDYFNGQCTWQTEALHRLLPQASVLMGDLILAEVLQGLRSETDFRTARDYLRALPFQPMGGYAVAVQSAANYRLLRNHGVTVRKTIDVIIGTFCILEGLVLLHDDRDFAPLEQHLSLQVVPTPS